MGSSLESRMIEARQALAANKPSSAYLVIKRILKRDPGNISARVLQAMALLNSGELLRSGAAVAPLLEESIGSFSPESLRELASVCFQLEFFPAAVQLYSALREQGRPGELAMYRLGIASLKLGLDEEAETCFRSCLEQRPEVGATWLQMGHLYKTRGDAEQAEKHYKQYILLSPTKCGTGYWSLADLKGYRFTTSEVKAMEDEIDCLGGVPTQAAALSFALGCAYEQGDNPTRALSYYNRGNRLRQQIAPFRKEHFCHLVEALQGIEIREPMEGDGVPVSSAIPIFIVGLPRSGTTLIEQILSSHSKVSATGELPFMERMALELEVSGGYASALESMSRDKIESMRDHYLKSAAAYLQDECGFFIDKAPSNFIHIGLIKTLFPEALVIDSRRDPRDNAISVYRQNFNVGNEFSYSFENISLYYDKYQKIMAHWHIQFPDTVRQQSYENLVTDPKLEIAALLEFCGLVSETACFEFYNQKRNIMTPSVSQVTRPMYTSSIGQWKAFEPMLEQEMSVLGAFI